MLWVGTASLPASAEVTVTVQISGTIEEIMPILQMLQSSGFNKAAQEKLDGLKLEINSSTEATPTAPPATATAPATPPASEAAPVAPAMPPQPALAAPVVQPAVAKPGDQVLITVAVTNPEGRIDTLAARQGGAYAFDLYDNGTRGDAVAGDGVWSYLYTVNPNAPDGPIDLELNAFNAGADPVKVKNEAGEEVPLTVHAVITVQKPQP
jgi:hypothetical protein